MKVLNLVSLRASMASADLTGFRRDDDLSALSRTAAAKVGKRGT